MREKKKKPANSVKFERKNEEGDGKITIPRSTETRHSRKQKGLMDLTQKDVCHG